MDIVILSALGAIAMYVFLSKKPRNKKIGCFKCGCVPMPYNEDLCPECMYPDATAAPDPYETDESLPIING